MTSPLERVRRILARISASRRRLILHAGLAAFLTALVGLAGVDFTLRFDFWARGLAFLLLAGAAGAAVRYARRIYRPVADESRAALVVERHRLLNELFVTGVEAELVRYSGSPAVAAEVVRRAGESVSDLDDAVVDPRSLGRAKKALIASCAIALFVLAAAPEASFRHASRLLLPFAEIDPMSVARLSLAPGDVEILRGDSLVIVVRATSRIESAEAVDFIEIETEGTNGARNRYRVMPEIAEDGARRFALTLEHLQEAFRYRASGGDAVTYWKSVEVFDAPRIASLRVAVDPPSYSKSATKISEDPATLSVIEGSSLRVDLTSDLPLRNAEWEWTSGSISSRGNMTTGRAGADVTLDSSLLPGDSGILRFYLRGRHGRIRETSRNLRIGFVPDEPPWIRLDWPGADNKAVPSEELQFALRVEDDLAVAGLDILVSIGAESEGIWRSMPGNLGTDDSFAVRMKLEEYVLEAGDIVGVRLRARDERPIIVESGKGVLITIVPYERFYRYVPNLQMDSRARELASQLEKFISLQKQVVVATPPLLGRGPDNRNRAADLQQKVREAVESKVDDFREFLKAESTGGAEVMTALELAGQAMKRAEDALREGRDQKGYAAELEALSELTKAQLALLTIITPARSGASQSGQLVEDDQIPREEIPSQSGGEQEQAERQEPSSGVGEQTKELLDAARQALEDAAASQGGDGESTSDPTGGGRSGEDADRMAAAARRLAEGLIERDERPDRARARELRNIANELEREARRRRGTNTTRANNSGALVDTLSKMVRLLEDIREGELRDAGLRDALRRLADDPDDVPSEMRELIREYFESLQRRRD